MDLVVKGNYSEQFISDICFRVAETGDFLGFVRQYMYDEDKQVVRNALCAMTKTTDIELEQLKPMMNELIEYAMKTDSPSIRRPLLGIVERMEMAEEDLRTDFLDFCFERMLCPDEAPSVQALCMKLANKMCRFYPELTEELRRTLEAMDTSCYKPAVKSVRRNILTGKL